jgi:hypothetical protein
MITEAFQIILKYVTPGQENIVIQNVCKKLSFASNDSEEKLDQNNTKRIELTRTVDLWEDLKFVLEMFSFCINFKHSQIEV